jgi:hypothetical protein
MATLALPTGRQHTRSRCSEVPNKREKLMLIVVNVILVAAAFMLVLVIAATSSVPSRQASGLDSPEGDSIGPASLPNDAMPLQPGSGRNAVRRRVAAAGMR